jgi:hypothetical protein
LNRLFTSYPGSGRSSFFPYHLHFLFPILSKLPIKFKINSLSYQCFVAVIICLGGPPYVNHNCFPSLKCLFFLELIFASFFSISLTFCVYYFFFPKCLNRSPKCLLVMLPKITHSSQLSISDFCSCWSPSDSPPLFSSAMD